MIPKFRLAIYFFGLVYLHLQITSSCFCQTLTWDGQAGTGFWGGNNWVEGTYADGANVVFGELDNSSANITTSLFADGATTPDERVPLSIMVTRQSGSVSITPGSGSTSHLLRIRSGGITVQNSNSRLVVETNTRLRVGQTWAVQDATGELIVRDGDSTKTLDLNGNILTINGPGNTTIRTDIFNSGSIDKKGDGTLTLMGNNTFSGGIAVNNGELDIASDASLGSGHLQINGARLFITGNTNIDNPITFDNNAGGDVNVPNFVNVFQNEVEFSGAIVGGQWAKRGSGTLEVSGSNTGFVGVENGTLLLTNPNALQAGADILAGARLWAATSGDWNSSAPLSGSGKFEKSGVGRLTLNGTTTTFVGDYEIEGGQLAMSPGRYNNRPIQTNRSTAEAVFLGSGSYTGGMTGSGKLIKEGSGELLLTGSNSYTAGTIVSGGVLSGDANSIRGTVTLQNNTGLKVAGSGTFGNSILGSGNLTKAGNDRLLLGGNNTFSGSIAILDGVLAGDTTSIQQPVSVSSGATLEFSFSSGTRTFAQPISGAGGLTKSGGGELTISAPNSYTGNTVVSDGTLGLGNDNRISDSSSVILENNGRLDLNDYTEAISHLSGVGTVDLGSGTLLLGQYNNSSTYGGSIVGTGDVVKIGSGILTLSGSSTYSGATDIQAGTLEIIGSNRISNNSDLNVAAAATFDLNGNSETIDLLTGSGVISLESGALGVGTTGGPLTSSVFSGSIQGEGGSLQKLGEGNLGLTGSNTYTGTTNITSGSISIGGNERLSNSSALHVNAGALFDLNNNTQTIDQLSGSGDIAIGAGLFRVGANNASSIFTGEIRGTSGTLEKLGTGTLTLSGNNIYQDGTIISDGSLVVTASNLPGDTVVNGDGKLVFGAGSATYSGNISGTGVLRKETESTVSITGNNTHTGGTEIAGGVLSANLNSLKGDVAMSNDSELWLTVTSSNPGIYTGNISGMGSLRKAVQGGGKLTLVGSNSYTGGTSVEAGILEGDSSSLQGAISVDSGAEVLFTQSAAGSFVGTLSGGGILRKQGAGNLTIGGATTHTGGTFVEAGKLVGNTTSLQGSINSDTEVIISQSSNGTFSASLSGPGKLSKIKVGEITVTGPNSYAGGTDVLAGKLIANSGQSLGTGDVFVEAGATLAGTPNIVGNLAGGGTVSPGNSPGIIVIGGDFTQTSDSILEIEVGGLTPGPGSPNIDDGHDQVQVGGTAMLDGRLEVPIINTSNFTPSISDPPIQFLTAGSRVGEFNAVVSPNLATVDPNLAIEVDYQPNGAAINFVPIKTNIVFDEEMDTTADWFQFDTWEDLDDPSNNVIPGLPNDLSIQNLIENDQQQVNVQSQNAFVAKLTIGGGTENLTLSIGNGNDSDAVGNLSSTLGVSVVDHGTIALNQDTLATTNVMIDGGMLSGEGLIDLDGGSTSQVGKLTVADGMVSPGTNGVGSLVIDGEYEQQADGSLMIDVVNATSDTLDISGEANLEGTVEVMLNNIADAPIGTVFEVITAGSVVGTFDEVVTSGVDDIYLAPIYGSDFAAFRSTTEGDMNPFVFGVGQEDAAAFATALTDPDAYRNTYGTSAQEAGDIDDDGDIDFDDIDDFVALLPNMTMAQMMTVIQAAQQSVPEPTGCTLALLALCGLCLTERQRGRAFRQGKGLTE